MERRVADAIQMVAPQQRVVLTVEGHPEPYKMEIAPSWSECLEMAHAAIRAMENPTKQMLDACMDDKHYQLDWRGIADAIWVLMIRNASPPESI